MRAFVCSPRALHATPSFLYAGNNVPLWSEMLAVNNGISALTVKVQKVPPSC